MGGKKDLTDVIDAIQNTLDTSVGDVCKELAVSAISITNPMLGTAINLGLQHFNEIKLRLLLRGLASDQNIETRLNQLYAYVKGSATRAFAVANTFRETIAANSPHICMLYGIILSKHLGSKESDFSQDDIIVCRALENASDYDLDIYKELMTHCVTKEKEIAYRKQDKKRYDITCVWCANNRLFTKNGYIHAELSGNYDDIPDEMIINTHYHIESAAVLLYELIKELEQVWNY